MCCGGFNPEFSIGGEVLQNNNSGDDLEMVTLSISSYANQTYAIFGWRTDEAKIGRRFVDFFPSVDSHHSASLLLETALEYSENFSATPSWWNHLPDFKKQSLQSRRFRGMPNQIDSAPQGSDLTKFDPHLLEAECIQTLWF